MLSLVGAALIIGASTVLGFSLAAEKKKRVLIAEAYLALTERIEDALPSLLALEDILRGFENRTLEREGFFNILRNKNSSLPCNKRILYAIELHREDKALYGILLPLARELGSTDYARQKRSLEGARTTLAGLCKERHAAAEKAESLYKWLGVLTGAMAVILLI